MAQPEDWERATSELREIIGDVTMTLTEIEDSLDEIILDTLTHEALYSFFKRRVLGRWMLGAKVDLLIAYVDEFSEVLTDAETALQLLRDIKTASEERNRLIHDLHDVDFDDGHITRRRLWEQEGKSIDLASYRDLAGLLTILSGPGMDALGDALVVG